MNTTVAPSHVNSQSVRVGQALVELWQCKICDYLSLPQPQHRSNKLFTELICYVTWRRYGMLLFQVYLHIVGKTVSIIYD